MRWLRRIGLSVLVILVLVAIFLGTWEPLTAARAEAPPPHTYDVTVARDTYGVPHIFGGTDPDVAYGIAYAHAEDDFSTLQEVLAMTRGRLGAMTGGDGAKTDFALHFLDARATVDRDYDKQPADVRALLDGYASGLNKYAERHPDEVRLARLFPVDGRDVATGFVMRSPFFFGLDATLGALVGDKPLPRETAPAEAAPNVTPVGPNGRENGSNAFVIAPKKTSDGATRMVSNSHQPWTGGVAWYELVVHSRTGWNFAGATFPGAPYPLLGHNATLGWTNTVNRPDLIDTYKLTLNDAGDAYRFDGQWRPLEKRLVWLRVKLWGPFVLPVPKYVYRAVQGPVIENKSGAYAIRYGGADQLKMVEEYYRLNRARDFGEWQKALAIQGVPATNFLYADAAGHIAYFYNASFPNRKPGYDYRKLLPGDTSADYAPGTVPWRMVPRNVDPTSGFLVNANSTPFLSAGPGSELKPSDWSPLLGIETDTTNRDNRALQLMLATPKIGAAEMARIKFDTGVAKTGWTAKWFGDLMAVDPKGDALIGQAQALLRQWDWTEDGKGAADSLADILMHAGQTWHYQRLPEADPRTELVAAARYLKQHFGRLDVPLGTVLRLRRGKVDLPLDGGPEILRAAANWDEAPDGRLVVKHGDSFVMFVTWLNGHVSSQSIQPYGAASTRPNSPHYADQAALFVQHRLKPVYFYPGDLKGHIERAYRP
ncbi:penicillin acylase family protein [Sphingomonas sp.]|jgi:acyl-homoserine-lactone acylase|uniref:penicillin acylase family protein n=1 Tax=Sphingomonas sp. TaxID=28214 RepID=UPI002E2F8208|nr:penicillin acylase family protein [Sphingomonas sp.]HEX4692921.1 penicillin acylase family protein [Sphingomonas sp.]